MANYEVTEGFKQHGTKVFISQGFMYIRGSTSHDKVYLRCALRTVCKGTAILDKTSDSIEAKKMHNHDISAYTDKPDLMRKLRRAVAENRTSNQREVFNRITREDTAGSTVSYP